MSADLQEARYMQTERTFPRAAMSKYVTQYLTIWTKVDAEQPKTEVTDLGQKQT
jgi:hypothetical protein